MNINKTIPSSLGKVAFLINRNKWKFKKNGDTEEFLQKKEKNIRKITNEKEISNMPHKEFKDAHWAGQKKWKNSVRPSIRRKYFLKTI